MSNIAQKRPFGSLVHDEEPESNTTTPPPSPPLPVMTASELKFATNLVKTLMRNKRALAFLNPVDAVALNVPDYYDIIQHPMDLGTINLKLKTGQYYTLNQVINDIQLVFDNCYLYNNAGDPVCLDAAKVEEAFRKHLQKLPSAQLAALPLAPPAPPSLISTPKITFTANNNNLNNTNTNIDNNTLNNFTIPVQNTTIPAAAIPAQQQTSQQQPLTINLSRPKNTTTPAIETTTSTKSKRNTAHHIVSEGMPDDQFKRCESIVKELKKTKYHDISWPFQHPVDAQAWGATDYYDIIKKPMDMSQYERNLYDMVYQTEDELADDIRLMFSNCYAYNPAGHEVNILGHRFEEVFEKYWDKLHQDKKAKKRRVSKDLNTTMSHLPPTPSSQPPTYNHHSENPVPSTAITSTSTTSTTTTTTATATVNPGSSILRVKLNVRDPTEKAEQQRKKIVAPGLALSREPSGPKLAIDNKPPSPTKKKSETPTTKLYNNDQWLALAKGSANKKPTNVTTPHTIKKHTPHVYQQLHHHQQQKQALQKQVSPPPPPPAPVVPSFDILNVINTLKTDTKQLIQESREEQERKEREEKLRLEKQRQESERKMQRIREQNFQAQKMKQRDMAQRFEQLNNANVINISRQKLLFTKYENFELRKDGAWKEMQSLYGASLNYRVIPKPGFIKRFSEQELSFLRAKLLSKSVRLTQNGHSHSHDGDSDMDVE